MPDSMRRYERSDEMLSLIRYYAMINDHDVRLAILGARLRRQLLRSSEGRA